MILFPAIDLKEGLAVRLEQGDMTRATIFHRDPAVQARAFEQRHASFAGLAVCLPRPSHRQEQKRHGEQTG